MAPPPSRRRWRGRNGFLPGGSLPDGNVDEAVAEPLHHERLPGIPDRLVAHVLARAVVDLRTGRFEDGEHGDQPATRLEPAAVQARVREVQPLAAVRRQQLAAAVVSNMAGARQVGRELDVLTLGRELVEI